MYTVIFLIIVFVVLAALGAIYTTFKTRINFFITGLDSGFSISEILLLWKTAELCNLEHPTSLFFSLPSLTKCMTLISNQTGVDPAKNQLIMSKLFDYRTKIQNESDDKKGLSSTRSLDKNQPLRIILPGKGVFASEILGNGNQLVISIPKQKNLIPFSGEEWVGKVISVYLWRKGDARYVFDTTVTQSGLFIGKSALFINHSANLVRTQKRKAVRVKCQIHGMLYILRKEQVDVNAIETQNGFRCILEDISEAGALIRIGGKGIQNVRIKLQFNIHNKLILMVGVIRTVEYNTEKNQSLLHFECTSISPAMRNEVLKFVYNLLPESEKEVFEALEQTEDDEKADTPVSNEESIKNDIEKSIEKPAEEKPAEPAAESALESTAKVPDEASETPEVKAEGIEPISEDAAANDIEDEIHVF
ncbi:MAG: PilZ domain-containing protein [Treponema sp.]|nr:PilZ domain-containing protein [Treponema sp.]